MKKYGNLKLTRKTAAELICSTLPVPKKDIQGGEKAPGVFIYTVQVGALEVTCSNDWYTHNKRIQLTVSDGLGGNTIRMYFHPDTLNRDFGAEDADKEQDRREARMSWAQNMGRERAHQFVDQYCEGC